jgi:hypothetical protein
MKKIAIIVIGLYVTYTTAAIVGLTHNQSQMIHLIGEQNEALTMAQQTIDAQNKSIEAINRTDAVLLQLEALKKTGSESEL